MYFHRAVICDCREVEQCQTARNAGAVTCYILRRGWSRNICNLYTHVKDQPSTNPTCWVGHEYVVDYSYASTDMPSTIRATPQASI